MLNLFDVENGEVHIGNKLTLRAGSTSEQLSSAGLTFVREFDMKTQWVFRITAPIAIPSHEVQLALGFCDNRLKRASFGFVEDPALDMSALYNKHNAFLHQELGSPTSENEHRIQYQYKWGEIVSEMDLRGGGSSIWLAWR